MKKRKIPEWERLTGHKNPGDAFASLHMRGGRTQDEFEAFQNAVQKKFLEQSPLRERKPQSIEEIMRESR